MKENNIKSIIEKLAKVANGLNDAAEKIPTKIKTLSQEVRRDLSRQKDTHEQNKTRTP
jgi:hypothetical protein